MNIALDHLHYLWLALLVTLFSAGWGARLARALKLPSVFVLPLGFACFACGAYVVFFAFFATPALGWVTAYLWGLICMGLFVWEWRLESGRALLTNRDAWLPGALLILLGFAYLALLSAGDVLAAKRFIWWGLPVDNLLPRYFAGRLASGFSPKHFFGDWLSSDRPPLQSAIELALRPWYLLHSPDYNYQSLGTLAQLQWLPALYALGRVVHLKGRRIAFVLLCCATTGFFLVNSIYVWPKLLSASLVLTALVVLLDSASENKAPPKRAAVIGACIALGLLAHGGSAFTLLALPALPAAWRFLARTGWKGICLGALTLLLVQAPWIAYQKLYDPPANRLIKWHLAGQIAIDDRGALQTLRESYSARSAADAWIARRENLKLIFWYPEGRYPTEILAQYLCRSQFFGLLAALEILALGLLVLAGAAVFLRRALPEHSGGLLLHAVVTLAIWFSLMFLPLSTSIHQSSYVMTSLFFFLGAVGVAILPAWLRWPIFAGHVILFVWMWIVSNPPGEGAHMLPTQSVLSALAALCFIAALWLIPVENSEV